MLHMATFIDASPDDNEIAKNESVEVPTQLTHAPIFGIHERCVQFGFGINDPVSRAGNYGLYELQQTSLAIPRSVSSNLPMVDI